jgi:HNH endonuclease
MSNRTDVLAKLADQTERDMVVVELRQQSFAEARQSLRWAESRIWALQNLSEMYRKRATESSGLGRDDLGTRFRKIADDVDAITADIEAEFLPARGAVGERNPRVIPQDVKIAVAARDRGRCVQCGSGTDLHYDHKIPWSRGGSSTVNNIQLLCGVCNRRKGATELAG